MTTLIDRGERIEVVPSNDEWNHFYVENLSRGINKAERPDALEEQQLLTANGVRSEKSRLQIDQGYKIFGSAILGNPRRTIKFTRKNGTSHFLLITNTTVYEWSSSNTAWELVPTTTSTTLQSAAPATTTALNVVSETGFASNDPIGVTLSDGTMHVTTVASTSANTININDAIPSPGASNGAAVIKGDKLSGVDTEAVSIVPFPASDILVFTNGVDTLKKYDGTNITDLSGLPTSPFLCKIVAIFNNHLICLNTTEAGVRFPQRVRRSDTGNPENFTTGNAGYDDLFDSEEPITAAGLLGPYLIIYKTSSISRLEWVGDATRLFRPVGTVPNVGVPNPNAMSVIDDVHFLFGKDNIYEYNGGFDVTPLGDAVFDILFDNVSDLNRNAISSVITVYVPELKEIWVFYPTGSDTLPKDMIRVSRKGGGWFTRKLTIGISGYGFFSFAGSSLGWDDIIGSWLDQAGTWIGAPERLDNPTVHLLAATPTKQVYEYDYVESQDNGVSIAYEIETKDFYIPNRNIRFDRLDARVRGSGISVYYSIDGGRDWQFLGTLSPGSRYTDMSLHKQGFGKRVRFRFTGSGNGFGIEGFGFVYKRETGW